MSSDPDATMEMFMAALPKLLREWAIFPPSSLLFASVAKVFVFDSNLWPERDEPYSTPILEVSTIKSRQCFICSQGFTKRCKRSLGTGDG